MARPIQFADPAQNEFLAELEKRGARANHFFRTMANRPDALKTFVPFYAAVTGPGSVDRRTKELVYLTCSFTNACVYCSTAHRASGKRAGVTPEEMAALEGGQDSGFSESERAAIQYAREMTKTGGPGGAREILDQHFNDEQIVEITLVTAMANFTNRFNNGLGVQPES